LVYLKANISNLALEQFNANDQLRKNISILLERNKLFLNVRTRASDDYITVMSNIKTNNIIRTDIHWIYTFQSFFKEENIGNWDLILSVSETGGIFGGADISEKLDKKKLMLVCAYNTAWENDDVLGINDKANSSKKRKPNVTISDRRKLKLLNGKLSRIKDSVKLKLLHYRTHNNHLILFTKIKNDEIRFYGGIYYSRRQQTKRVTPIFTKNQDDLEQLFNIFANYWERATNEENMENFNEIIRQEKPNLNDIIFEVNKHKRHETVENIKARIIEEFNKL
jgi:hypothetical protein